MIPYTLIDGEKVLDATFAQIRQAVADGKMVVAVDNANVAMQIDKDLLARIDAPIVSSRRTTGNPVGQSHCNMPET